MIKIPIPYILPMGSLLGIGASSINSSSSVDVPNEVTHLNQTPLGVQAPKTDHLRYSTPNWRSIRQCNFFMCRKIEFRRIDFIFLVLLLIELKSL